MPTYAATSQTVATAVGSEANTGADGEPSPHDLDGDEGDGHDGHR